MKMEKGFWKIISKGIEKKMKEMKKEKGKRKKKKIEQKKKLST